MDQPHDATWIAKFGQAFLVRRGEQFVRPMWEEITGLREGICPEFLITNFHTDGLDGLCWTSWEECLMEYAVIQWELNPTRMHNHLTQFLPKDNNGPERLPATHP